MRWPWQAIPCHLTADIYPELADFARALNERQLDMPLVLRDRAQVTSFFEGLGLVEPGVVQLSKWRPRSEAEPAEAAALWEGGPQAWVTPIQQRRSLPAARMATALSPLLP